MPKNGIKIRKRNLIKVRGELWKRQKINYLVRSFHYVASKIKIGQLDLLQVSLGTLGESLLKEGTMKNHRGVSRKRQRGFQLFERS